MNLPNIKFLKIALLFKVRGIGTNKYKTNELIIISVYFPYKYNDINILVYIRYKFYLVNNLQV